MHPTRLLTTLTLLAGACAVPTRTATAPACEAGWAPHFNGDSSVALCAPAGFQLASASIAGELHSRWYRPHPGSPVGEWLSVRVVPQTPVDTIDRWPLALASDARCAADCATADSVRVHAGTVAGARARVETGRVTGGVSGLQRQHMLVASWEAAAGYRGYAWGYAESGAMLDTLRGMLRSASIVVRRP